MSTIGHARCTFGVYLNAWSVGASASALASALSDGAVLEPGVGQFGWAVKIEGDHAIARYVQGPNSVASEWTFSDVRDFPTLQQHIVFVEFDAKSKRAGSPQPASERHIALVELEGERIGRIADFSDSRWVLDAVLALGRNTTASAK